MNHGTLAQPYITLRHAMTDDLSRALGSIRCDEGGHSRILGQDCLPCLQCQIKSKLGGVTGRERSFKQSCAQLSTSGTKAPAPALGVKDIGVASCVGLREAGGVPWHDSRDMSARFQRSVGNIPKVRNHSNQLYCAEIGFDIGMSSLARKWCLMFAAGMLSQPFIVKSHSTIIMNVGADAPAYSRVRPW